MKQVLKGLIILFLIGLNTNMHGQATDLVRVEYTNFPQSNSDNSFSRFKTFLKLPIKLNEKGAYLVPGIQYQNVNFILEDDAPFETQDLEHLKSYSFSLGYTYKMTDEWRFGLEGEIDATSNFETGDLQSEDIEYTASVYFIKSKDAKDGDIRSWRLILGSRYSTASRIRFPLPIVNYFKRLNEKWSYTLGVPKTNLKYYLSDKHNFQAYVGLDNFFANTQNKFSVAGNSPSGLGEKLAQNISITTVLSGLGYELQFSKYFSFYIYGGYSLINNIRLRDENQDRVYIINDSNSLYGRTGLKFGIL